MKRRVVLFCTMVLIMSALSSCRSPEIHSQSWQGFSVEAAEGSYLRGTLFVQECNGKIENILLLGVFDVDPSDSTGICISFPEGWEFIRYVCSYPEDSSPEDSSYVQEFDAATSGKGRGGFFIAGGLREEGDVGGRGSFLLEFVPYSDSPERRFGLTVGDRQAEGIDPYTDLFF